MRMRRRQLAVVLLPGAFALLTAVLSVADMFVPRPFDGVILEADAPGTRTVRQVVPGSGADRAGIRAGDLIVGIDRTIILSTTRADALLRQHRIGETVPYLVSSNGRRFEAPVELGPRRVGDAVYLYVCLLGAVFFGVGAFVVVRQPRLPAARTFFTMCWLFMLFLVCRLRPASYSWVDTLVLNTGTVALLFLPGAFLHFFLIFPRPVWEWRRDPLAGLVGWLARPEPAAGPGLPAAAAGVRGDHRPLAAGRHPARPDQRRAGRQLVGDGRLHGARPRLARGQRRLPARTPPAARRRPRLPGHGVRASSPSSSWRSPSPRSSTPSASWSTGWCRWSWSRSPSPTPSSASSSSTSGSSCARACMYTLTTAVVTAVYALGIASFNRLVRGTELEASPYFPVLFALAIVLLFEPLRHRLQGPVDRFFFGERLRLQQAMVEMGEAFTVQLDPGTVVRQLVGRLPELLGLHFAALYLFTGDRLRRAAGPDSLPGELSRVELLRDHLQRYGALVRLEELAPLRLISPATEAAVSQLERAGVEVLGLLASPRRPIGVVLLSAKSGQMPLEREELELLRGLLHQAAIALETSLLLEERARQAELERELQIAASIQASLLPSRLAGADGWQVAAVCRPARAVGGDFYAELPGGGSTPRAVVYGDVSGKSISGALMMMAAHEVLNALALAHPEPEQLLDLANERLYTLRGRSGTLAGGSFVALGYLAPVAGSDRLRYTLAGQPPPMLCRGGGEVSSLPLPPHRVPLGAFRRGGYTVLETALAPGDLLVAYSDGVVEAQSAEGEFFGEVRLAEALSGAAGCAPERAVAAVLAALDDFTRGHTPYDDLTLVAVARSEPAAPGGGP